MTSYKEVLGLRKIMDFGANVTLTGGVCLQTCKTWAAFIGVAPDGLGWYGGPDGNMLKPAR